MNIICKSLIVGAWSAVCMSGYAQNPGVPWYDDFSKVGEALNVTGRGNALL